MPTAIHASGGTPHLVHAGVRATTTANLLALRQKPVDTAAPWNLGVGV